MSLHKREVHTTAPLFSSSEVEPQLPCHLVDDLLLALAGIRVEIVSRGGVTGSPRRVSASVVIIGQLRCVPSADEGSASSGSSGNRAG